jgi:hypothetical protein
MALTITENFRMTAGGRAFRFVTITHDESTSTFTAGSVDLDYIEFVMQGTMYLASTPADTSTLINHAIISITNEHTVVGWLLPPKAGSKSQLQIIGW